MIPDYSIELGDLSIDTSKPEEVLQIRVELNMDIPSDICHLGLGISSKVSEVKLSDPVSISLGYDTKTKVFTGTVESLVPEFNARTQQLTIEGLSQMQKLQKQRLTQTYLNQNAGEIVKDICNKAALSVGKVEDGLSLPRYHISRDVPSYHYVKELAIVSGFDLYMNTSGELIFKEFKSENVHELEFGNQIIKLESLHYSPPGAVKVYGESPSSSMGSDTSHWLSKDKMEGTAGDGEGPVFYDAAIRDQDTADSAARARLARARQTFWITTLAIGVPEVKIGDSVSFKGFDLDKLNSEFKIRSIEHRLLKGRGFMTRLKCSKDPKEA
jgi:phage protein D